LLEASTSAQVASWSWPGEISSRTGRPLASTRAWIFVVRPLWRDLPKKYGPYTTAYNRFNRWAQGGHLGSFDGRRDESPRRQGADDRQLDRAGTSARLWGERKSGVRCVGRSRTSSARRSRASPRFCSPSAGKPHQP